ncbi:Eukaryotic translation initiation factor 3 subunit G [Stylophora pistillata]|uniref:Eukaryotic translation initiation factor 3 subunit G n=1 Tax=Stylophora pistillata TaxID=50429 RepID=A0A2B4SDU0_STYPI|nr:Eukaryotic translation initiation factor 3 subunit G [Stylophora pistillata]
MSVVASASNMFAVTIDRIIAIRFPFKYVFMTTKHAVVQILLVWIVSLAFGVLYAPKSVSNMYIALYCTALLMATIVMYINIFIIAKRAENRIQNTQSALHRTVAERKIAKAVFTVIGVYALCWLPMLLLPAIANPSSNPAQFGKGFFWAQILLASNSAINPDIYCMRSKKYRVAFGKQSLDFMKTMSKKQQASLFVIWLIILASRPHAIELPYEVLDTIMELTDADPDFADLNRVNISDELGPTRPIYRLDVDPSYIAYYEVEMGSDYVVLASGSQTGDYRKVGSGPDPRPTDMFMQREEDNIERCEKFYRLSLMGLTACTDDNGTFVTATYNWTKDYPWIENWLELEQMVNRSLDTFENLWKKRAGDMRSKSDWAATSSNSRVILKHFAVDLHSKRHRRSAWKPTSGDESRSSSGWVNAEVNPREYELPDCNQHECCGCVSGCALVAWAQIFRYYDSLGSNRYSVYALQWNTQREGAGNRRGETMPRSQRDETATIRVTNLSEDTRESDLMELFRPFGPISRIFLAKDKNTNQSKEMQGDFSKTLSISPGLNSALRRIPSCGDDKGESFRGLELITCADDFFCAMPLLKISCGELFTDI